jgi:Ca-activated chloride channel family protein
VAEWEPARLGIVGAPTMDERQGGADEVDAAIRPRWSLGKIALVAVSIGGVAGAIVVLGDSPQVMPDLVGSAGDPSTMQADELVVDQGEIEDFLDEHLEGGSGQRHKGEEGKMGRPTSKNKSGLYAMKGPPDDGQDLGTGGLGLVGTGRGGGGTGDGTIGLGFGGHGHRMTRDEIASGEGYATIAEQGFVAVADDARSTFSVDVDTASYSNTRRMITEGSLPPAEAVRIEEFVNYFDYDYEQPSGDVPFSVTTEVGPCPWDATHKLVHVGLQGREIDQADVPARNLVFLLDVSGSMNAPDRLPLLVRSLELLVDQLRPQDHVGIVVYAGASGVVLEPTAGNRRADIKDALRRLESGGSTNGGAGIELAYRLAQQNFVEGGINRVVLATDGDFNVGTANEAGLKKLIEAKRKSGVFLSVLGFGRGNLKDDTMEMLADKGNGNYAYIDSEREAKKVLVDEAGGTLVTIAKDVKLQIELNPTEVASWRLVGYDNRRLAHQDFKDDTKDAGEIGAGHSVTAIYEIVPAEHGDDAAPAVDPLKYQGSPALTSAASSGEIMTIALRYKAPDGDTSKQIDVSVKDRDVKLAATSDDFRFSAAVVEVGLLLRRSEHAGTASWGQAIDMAVDARGSDRACLRGEFVDLAQRAAKLAGTDDIAHIKTCAS